MKGCLISGIALILILEGGFPLRGSFAQEPCLDDAVSHAFGRQHVTERVHGLYEGIPAKGKLKFGDVEISATHAVDGMYVTEIKSGSYSGSVVRQVEGKTFYIIDANMNRDELGGIPKFVKPPSGKELVPGRGTPTLVYTTLHQMRLAGVQPGALKEAIITSIQNVQTSIEIMQDPGVRAWLRSNPNKAIPRALLATAFFNTQTGRYVKTILTQSGHQIAGVKIEGDVEMVRLSRWDKEMTADNRKLIDLTLTQVGAGAPQYKVPSRFGIHIELGVLDE